MTHHTSEIVGRRVRDKQRIGVRGLEAGLAGEPVREVISKEVAPVVDRRRITSDGIIIGSITFNTESGEVISWDVSDEYQKSD